MHWVMAAKLTIKIQKIAILWQSCRKPVILTVLGQSSEFSNFWICLCKNIKIKIHRTTILSNYLYMPGILSLS